MKIITGAVYEAKDVGTVLCSGCVAECDVQLCIEIGDAGCQSEYIFIKSELKSIAVTKQQLADFNNGKAIIKDKK